MDIATILADLIASGLSIPQSETVLAVAQGEAPFSDLAVTGFSEPQIQACMDILGSADPEIELTQAGFWTGTEVIAIIEAFEDQGKFVIATESDDLLNTEDDSEIITE